jgi:hypothetical protein
VFGSWSQIEVVSILDPQVSRDWMDYAPVMALFVPPRIAVVEDRNRQIWLLMLDWDMHWLDTARNAAFDPKLRAQGLISPQPAGLGFTRRFFRAARGCIGASRKPPKVL